MRMGDAYIIVYSVTDKLSFEKASELRIQLRRARQSENIPIILVGNKSDLVRSREVTVDGELFTIWKKIYDVLGSFKIKKKITNVVLMNLKNHCESYLNGLTHSLNPRVSVVLSIHKVKHHYA